MCETDHADGGLDNPLCTDDTLFIENGKRCCLYRYNNISDLLVPTDVLLTV